MSLCREFDAKATTKAAELLDFVMAYEGGELEAEEIVIGFQKLIDKGIVWKLQGHYGRAATGLIRAGYCVDTHGILA